MTTVGAAALVAALLGTSGGDLLAETLAATPCGPAIAAALREWRTQPGQALLDPPEAPGDVTLRVPTDEIGVWVVLRLRRGEDPVASRVSAARVTDARWSAACQRRGADRRIARPPAGPARFTDADLRLAAHTGRGVVYVWSPHMPLSLDGYHEARRAAGDLGIRFIALLDPASDPGYARRAAAAHGIPADALLSFDSIELEFRGMTTHAPSLLAFGDAQIAAAGRTMFGSLSSNFHLTSRRGPDGLLS